MASKKHAGSCQCGAVRYDVKVDDMEFVLVPGAWAGGWLWDEVAGELRNRGHHTHQLSLSGLNGNSRPGKISLRTHVEDVHKYITGNTPGSVVLVGHSYSGIVIGQMASQFPGLIRHTIFIEAFLPVAGKSLLEVSGLNESAERAAISANDGAWPAPSAGELASEPMLTDEQIRMLLEKQRPHPGRTVTDPAELKLPLHEISASFMAHEGWLSGVRERGLVSQLKSSGNWTFHTIAGGHWPMLTIPGELAGLCHACAA